MSGGGFAGLERTERARLKKVFPLRVEAARKQRGLTNNRKFAELVGVTLTTLGAWMRGERLPRTSQLCVVARVLEVPLDFLLNPLAAVPDSLQSSGIEDDILQYIEVENGRGYSPTASDVSEACEADAWAGVLRLIALRLLEPSGLVLTAEGRGLLRRLEAR